MRRALILALSVLIVAACSSDDPEDAGSPTTATDAPTSSTATPSTTWSRPACPDPSLDRSGEVRLADPSLDEVSGVAISAWDPDVVWVIEDSGNPATATALSPTGSTTTSLSVTISNTDWEDLAIRHRDGVGTMFIGDIGDNDAIRPEVTVLRIAEPDPHGPPSTVEPETLTLRLPQPANAEALLVDPLTDDIVIVTKSLDGTATVLVGAGVAGAPVGSVHEMVDAGQLDLGLLSAVLAGDVAPDGSSVALRTPSRVLWWPRDPSRTLVETLTGGEPCALPSLIDPLGEAIALSRGGYVLVGEGSGARLAHAVE